MPIELIAATLAAARAPEKKRGGSRPEARVKQRDAGAAEHERGKAQGQGRQGEAQREAHHADARNDSHRLEHDALALQFRRQPQQQCQAVVGREFKPRCCVPA